MAAALAIALSAAAGCGRPPTADLIAQARSGDGAQRMHAIRALAERPKDADRVVPALAELLKDDDAFVRRDAAHALGQLGPRAEPALPALRVAARDRSDHVRRAVADALRKIEPGATP